MSRSYIDHEYDEADDMLDGDDGDDHEEELLARIERAFRSERARIRASEDLDELRTLRAEYQAELTDPEFNQVARIRAHDLIELLDDRITDIKAKQLVERRD